MSTAPSGTITKVNETFLTMTGYRREELEGTRTFADLLTGGGRIYHETHYRADPAHAGEHQRRRPRPAPSDGSRLPVLVNSVLERDGDDEPAVIRTAVFDATERRQYEQELLRAKERAERSEAAARGLARTLQQTLIPPALPAVPGIDVAAEYRPAGDGELVGGDFYDVFKVATDDWVIALGDVCGKGPDAAVITALVRYTIRATAVEHASPAAMLHVVNEVVLRHDDDRFCTRPRRPPAAPGGRVDAHLEHGRAPPSPARPERGRAHLGGLVRLDRRRVRPRPVPRPRRPAPRRRPPAALHRRGDRGPVGRRSSTATSGSGR